MSACERRPPHDAGRALSAGLLAALLTTIGCTGDVLDAPGATRGPGPSMVVPGSPADSPSGQATPREGPRAGADALVCSDLGRVGAPVPLRRLTGAQLERTVAGIFGVREKLSVSDERLHTFRSNVSTSLDANGARGYFDFAERVAAKVDLARCASASCVGWLLDEVGLRLFRRPLGPEQRARYQELYRAGGSDGARWVIAAMLQSPSLLYPDEVGEADGYLDDYAVAARLALVLWGENPDLPLLTRAAEGALSSPEAIREQAQRMLADPRSAGGVHDFVDQWLELHRLDDPDARPDLAALGPAVVDALRTEPVQLFRSLLLAQGGAKELLTTSDTVRTDLLISTYGSDLVEKSAERFALDPQRRAGILSLPGVMAALAHAGATSPTLRGYAVLSSLLCAPPPPPPAGVSVTLPEVRATATARERLEAHFSDASCGACHRTMDGIGFAFESLDWFGRSRERENDRPIDDTSRFKLSGEEITVDGIASLAARLAASKDVASCIARQWARYATGVEENAEGECLMRRLGDDVAAPGGLREMMLTYLTSDWFRRARALP